MHTVKRAIIMAAGIGSRMQPVSLETPKPLVKVNGSRMIDTVIEALRINGICEIYVVIGFLKEKFYSLPSKYPGIHLIENPYFDSCNNIASLYVAREHLSDCMILDGDQIIYNPGVLSPYFALSGYNAVWCEEQTNEWLLDVKNDVIQGCSRNGGSHGWQLYSISRWSQTDGSRLRKWVEYEFEKGNRSIYWDDVPMFCHFDEFHLGIWKMNKGDVVEIDGFDELLQIDPTYKNWNSLENDHGDTAQIPVDAKF